MAKAIQRIRVTLGINKRNYPQLLARSKAIYNAMVVNATLFPNAAPPMATLLVLITNFDTAQQATANKAKGTVPVRNAKAALLVTALESEETYVQGLCDASPEQAMELISAAGMQAKKAPLHDKAILQAKLVAGQPGAVQLIGNAALLCAGSKKRPTFNWQSSVDGGKSWATAPSTPHADTVITNLPLGVTAELRVSVTLGKVTGDWSQAVAILVH